MLSGKTSLSLNIEIRQSFSWINIRQVPWEVLKNEAEGRGFKHLPRDLANVTALKKHVWSLLLHKKLKAFATFRVISCTILFRLSTDVSEAPNEAEISTQALTRQTVTVTIADIQTKKYLNRRAAVASEMSIIA